MCGAALGVAGVAMVTRSRVAVMRRHACTDPLTGVANRAGLAAAWPAAAAGRPVVAVLDLDGFKPVNDLHGHAAGDRVLIEVARRLRTVARGGLVARLGG